MTQKRPKAEIAQMRALIDGDPANGKRGLTLQEVADLFGITKAAVRYHVGPVGRPVGRPPRKPVALQDWAGLHTGKERAALASPKKPKRKRLKRKK